MIRFYFDPTPNPAKVSLLLKELGLPYEVVPVDTSRGEQHASAFRAINLNGKVPAIVDTDTPGGEVRVFDSSAILLYLAEKAGRCLGTPAERGELLSRLFFIASGLGPFSGQAVHFQFAAPEGLDYARYRYRYRYRYRREAERHYQVLEDHLAGRDHLVGDGFTIADQDRKARGAGTRRQAWPARVGRVPAASRRTLAVPASEPAAGVRSPPRVRADNPHPLAKNPMAMRSARATADSAAPAAAAPLAGLATASAPATASVRA